MFSTTLFSSKPPSFIFNGFEDSALMFSNLTPDTLPRFLSFEYLELNEYVYDMPLGLLNANVFVKDV